VLVIWYRTGPSKNTTLFNHEFDRLEGRKEGKKEGEREGRRGKINHVSK
jgi:hypothetical protein